MAKDPTDESERGWITEVSSKSRVSWKSVQQVVGVSIGAWTTESALEGLLGGGAFSICHLARPGAQRLTSSCAASVVVSSSRSALPVASSSLPHNPVTRTSQRFDTPSGTAHQRIQDLPGAGRDVPDLLACGYRYREAIVVHFGADTGRVRLQRMAQAVELGFWSRHAMASRDQCLLRNQPNRMPTDTYTCP